MPYRRSYYLLIIKLVFVLFLISGKQLSAQPGMVFTGDLVLYPEELRKYMQNVSGPKRDVVNKFINAWILDSIFTETEQKNIIYLSRQLIDKGARPDPHFVNFLSCMHAFKIYEFDQSKYNEWLRGIDEIINRKKITATVIDDIFCFTDQLIRENIIYQSSSTKWKANNKDYKILNNDGLKVEFDLVDLVCYAKNDSMHLSQTKGIVDPVTNIWKGEGGIVTWERGGYNPNEVFAVLEDYEIDLSRPQYTAENVTFTHKHYFDEPLKGILEDKVIHFSSIENATYPRFESYTKEFHIEDLYENINYDGGLSMQGSKLLGTGTPDKTAKLMIYRYDTLVLIASSLNFGFKTDRVSSQQTSVVIKMGLDSIYHPDLFFTYKVENRELILLKTDNYSSQGSYSDSYHKINMNFDQLTWRMDQNFMTFSATRGTTIGNAYFESVNYFNYDRYLDMMMMDKVHPLAALRNFSRQWGFEEFPIRRYAEYLNMPLNQVQQTVMRMAYEGYVYYDINTGIVKIKPQLYDCLAASVNKIDYDVIAFVSKVEAPLENAVFDMATNNLTINGIPAISVSNSQNVRFYPRNNRIVLQNNRNFQFDGIIEAGLFTFSGNNFYFDYDSFKVNLQNVDSLKFSYLTGRQNNAGISEIAEVDNILQGITGELFIDNPDNKSGKNNYPNYPIFKSKESSYVYYEKNNIQDGVYESSDFYFEVFPFEIDSLDNFNYKDLYFKGQFTSAGILPVFQEELSLQADNSLGFRRMAPPLGFSLYDGKGTFYNEISLSNKGLKGNGKVTYINSTTLSQDFNFYPDSMNTLSSDFNVALRQTEPQCPNAHTTYGYIHWLPYADEMYARKTDTDFTIINDTTLLSGEVKVTPDGLTARGRLNMKSADLISDEFTFSTQEIFADTADFYLKSLNTDGYTVLTDNVNSHVSYIEKRGTFRSNEGYSLVSFPENKYVSYIDLFEWDMSKQELAMGSPVDSVVVDYTQEDIEPVGSRYISIDPQQDSLNFVSALATYDYRNNYIKASGVKFIEVADARIYPYKGDLVVNKDAKLKTLEKALIRTNRDTKYHTLHACTLNIEGKKFYSGLGKYDFINENGDTQVIQFDEIKVDSGLQTIADGEIRRFVDFTISPVYMFQGKVHLESNDSLLFFTGGVLPKHDCDQMPAEWLYIKTKIDPENILIPLQEQDVNLDRNKIFSGIYLNYDSVHLYPAFMSPAKRYSDKPVVTARGYLQYDRNQHIYKIGSKEKIDNFSLPDDYLSFYPEDCKLYGEGKINLGEELGEVNLETYGIVKHDLNKNETSFDIILMVDFFMDKSLIKIMGEEIDSMPGLEAVDLERIVMKKWTDASVGTEKAQKLRDEMMLFGSVKQIPSEMRHTLVFNQVRLKWNDVTNSYRSEGKIGIGTINDVQINKQVDGFIELQIKRSGDILDIYLDMGSNKYYYFGYTRGVMQTLSSNSEFVETIMNMKPKDRTVNVGEGKTPYIYLIATDSKRNYFYAKYRQAKMGIEPNKEEEAPIYEAPVQ